MLLELVPPSTEFEGVNLFLGPEKHWLSRKYDLFNFDILEFQFTGTI